MLNIISSVIVLFGTILTLWEWINPYKGPVFNHERNQSIYGIDPVVDGALPVETDAYKGWKKKRRTLILIGIIMIVVGTVLITIGNI